MDEFKYINNLMYTHIIPAIQKSKADGITTNKTLWYVSDNDGNVVVTGPFKFNREFFIVANYTDEAIQQLSGLLTKARKESGIVISINYQLEGMDCNNIKNIRIADI